MLTVSPLRFALLLVFLSACDMRTADKKMTPDAKAISVSAPDSIYETRTIHSPDGIGKFYMGREIAHVMGHQAADWLERPERESEEVPSAAIAQLDLKATDAVADIGVGTGYYALRIGKRVSKGKVYGVDIQPEMLELLKTNAAKQSFTNIVPVLGSITAPNLPDESIDLALMVDAYHEFSHPREMMIAVAKSLKRGGRLALIEFRGEDDSVPIKELHKMTEVQAKKEMSAAGLAWKETKPLRWQHLMIFQKP
ncbi:MAG: class I SAM-dependent methyltransferase [Rhizobacter sp.]|nr:class I SAM-dependent methyltransferase [Chlorobiales bacterium]